MFRAINDPSRRLLLDTLYEQDGQTLGELCGHLPGMTRYGVMNHLKVLEAAGLVIAHRHGRSKFHYLNPVPLRVIHDRWISRYAALRVGAITGLEARMKRGEHTMDKPLHIYKSYIRGTAEEVWDAITNPAKTVQYFYGTAVESAWQVGSSMSYYHPDGRQASEGEILAIDPPKRLEFTFRALWDEQLAAEGPAREVWRLNPVNEMVELVIELYDAGPRTVADFSEGFPYIVAGLKSLVETGVALPPPNQA